MALPPSRGAARDAGRLMAEFEGVADQIQRSLLDFRPPAHPGLEIGVRAAPARIVGGDYLDVVARSGRAPLFAIGDVSGKSLPAALRAVTLKALVRGLISVLGQDVLAIVRHCNAVICDDIDADSFVTFSLATFTDDLRTLRVANAGHDPALVYRPSRGTIESLEESGLVLGIDPAYEFREQALAVEPGDVIAFYTDGFTEATNAEGEQFTLAHVKDGLLDDHALPAQELADALFARIEHFSAGTLRDDASIMIVRVLA